MQIKKFEAQSMSEALRLIKQEFGSEAVILSVKKCENGKGLLGFSKVNGVEVTAATDVPPSSINRKTSQGGYAYYKHPRDDGAGFDISERKKGFITSLRQGKKLFDRKNESLSWKRTEKNRDSKELFAAYHHMLTQDLDETIALELTNKVNRLMSKDSYLYSKGFKPCFVQVLEENGVTASRVKIAKQKQKRIALIGTTGVGKTTTIAKLAVAAKTRDNKQSVALITLDDKRIGAVGQLKLYAKIMGVPFRAASCKNDLKKYLEKLNSYDLIFIDTPGVSQCDQNQINTLKSIFNSIQEVEIQLTLSAATNDKTLTDVVEKFTELEISRLIFTKLDESINYGSILNQLYRSKIPVSYFTNGQQVPEDIEAANIEKLADMLFDGKDEITYLSGSPEELARKIIEFEKMLQTLDDEKGFDSEAIVRGNNERYTLRPSAFGERKYSGFRC